MLSLELIYSCVIDPTTPSIEEGEFLYPVKDGDMKNYAVTCKDGRVFACSDRSPEYARELAASHCDYLAEKVSALAATIRNSQ